MKITTSFLKTPEDREIGAEKKGVSKFLLEKTFTI